MSAAVLQWRVWSVGGVPTEVFGLDAAHGTCQLQVLLIPGNPGSCEYFFPFLEHLHALLGGTAEVLALTHPGHVRVGADNSRLWSLEEQIAHKVAFLKEHVLLPGRPPVVLIGHSIGAYMMVKAVSELEAHGFSVPPGTCVKDVGAFVANPLACLAQPNGNGHQIAQHQEYCPPPIIKLCAIFPFFELRLANNPRAQLLTLLAPRYELMGLVAAAVSLLPEPLRLAFVRLNSKACMDPHAVRLTAQLLQRDVVRNAFYLASHEFKDLSLPMDWALLRRLTAEGRLHVMGCPGDTWLSREQYEEMHDKVPGLQATWHEDMHHAFCTSVRQSHGAARALTEPILQALQQQQQLTKQPAAVPAMATPLFERTATAPVAASPAAAAAKEDGMSLLARVLSAASVSWASSPDSSNSSAWRSGGSPRSGTPYMDRQDTEEQEVEQGPVCAEEYGSKQQGGLRAWQQQWWNQQHPHEDQRAPYVVGWQRRGYDVVGGLRHVTAAAAAVGSSAVAAVVGRLGARSGSGTCSEEDVAVVLNDQQGGGRVDGEGDVGRGRRGLRAGRRAKLHATSGASGSGGVASGVVAVSGVVTRSMARRQQQQQQRQLGHGGC